MSFDSLGTSAAHCLGCKQPWLEFGSNKNPSPEPLEESVTRVLHAELSARSVWTRGVAERLLADPCLQRASERTKHELSTLTLSIVHELTRRRRSTPKPCHHAVSIDSHLCTTLTYKASHDDERVGLVNISDFLAEESPPTERLKADLPVPSALLEAAADEPTMSVDEMNALQDWDPRHCGNLRGRRPWAHLILVSHEWKDPQRPLTEWSSIKQKVNEWVDDQLAKDPKKRDPRNKAQTREDYGVWVDYMMVPNGHHDGHAGVSLRTLRRREEADDPADQRAPFTRDSPPNGRLGATPRLDPPGIDSGCSWRHEI